MKQPYNTTIYNTALYMRLSRDDELQGDDGWSGTNFDRPDFQRMIDDIEDGKINCVVTKDLSRLGRNYILTGQYTEIYFPSKGVRYIAVNDNVDTINGENELAPFLNILNEMHARQTSKKVKAAMRTRFANGAHYGAYAPLGYVKDPDKKGHLLIDPETRWIIEKIFDLAVHGRGAASITRILVEEKVPTPGWLNFQRYGTFANIYAGAPEEKAYAWTIAQVKSILKEETYIGHSVHNKQTNGSNAKKRRAPWKLQPLSFRKRFAVFCLIFGGGMLFYMMSFIFGMPEGVLMADFLEGITTQMIAFIFSFVPNGEALAQPIYNGFQLTPIGIVIGMFMVAVVAMLAISLIYTVVMTKKAHDAAAPKFMIS